MTHHLLRWRGRAAAAAGSRWRLLFRRLFRVLWGRILSCSPTAAGAATVERPMRYHRIRACGCFCYDRGMDYGDDHADEGCATEAGHTPAAARVLLRRSSDADADEVDDADLVALKISLLGDCQIGKTTFMVKYVGDEEEQSGLQLSGLNLMDKILVVRGARIAFSIWDVGGGDQSLDHLSIACRDAVAILIMFDLTSRSTLINSISWYKRARKWNKTAIPILIGTKFDDFVQLPLEMQWTVVNQARSYARAMHASLFFSSATHNINVNKIFKFIAAKLFNLPWTLERNLTIGEPIIDF